MATIDTLNDSPSVGYHTWQILTANSYSLPRYALSARSKGHVTLYKPLYLENGSFSDHVSYVNLNLRSIAVPTVYDMTTFGEIFLNFPYDVIGQLRHFRSAKNKIPPSLESLVCYEHVCKMLRSDNVVFKRFW